MAHECSECGEKFQTPSKLAAHTRWEHPKEDESDDEDTKEDKRRTQTLEDIDNPDFIGEQGTLEVRDKDTPAPRCPNCKDPVKPGQNCQSCGEQLDWRLQ